MLITLNGDAYRLQGDGNLTNLLDQIGLRDKRVAVEHNGEIIPRSQHAQLELKPGDVLEIVQAIGGG